MVGATGAALRKKLQNKFRLGTPCLIFRISPRLMLKLCFRLLFLLLLWLG